MGEQETFGDDGLQIAHDLFNAWRAYQQDGDRARLQAQIAPLQAKLRALLEHAARKGRVGFEPTTLGLKVHANELRAVSSR